MNSANWIIVFICFLWFNSFAQIKGVDNIVGETFTIPSKILDEDRTIQIFTPDNYSTSEKSYPVLFILDGQRYFLHGVSLYQSFTNGKQTPEFIIVGISKTSSERNRNFSSNASNFLAFLEKEVIHFIDANYRTSKERLLFGWAYGGGFVLQTMITKPELFATYIAASPFPLEGKINQLDTFFMDNPKFKKSLYFTSGTNEGVVKEGTFQLNSYLSNNAPESMNWTFTEMEGEEHRSTPYASLYHGIRTYYAFYPELQFNNLSAFKERGGLPYVYDYYEERAKQFGFSPKLSDWTMFSLTRNAIRAEDYEAFNNLFEEFKSTDFINRLRMDRACSIADFYLKNKKQKKAISIFQSLAKNNPNTIRPLEGLGKAYEEMDETEKAKSYHEKAKQLSETNN